MLFFESLGMLCISFRIFVNMKLSQVVFSPTGTSARIAAAVAAGAGMSSRVIDVTRDEDCNLVFDPDDLVIIAAPVYGGHMSPKAAERMSGMVGNGAKCVLVAVYGNRAFENALVDMSDFAEAHGFVPVAVGAFIGEHSYSTAVHPIAAGRPDAADIAFAERFGKDIACRLESGALRRVDVTTISDQPSSPESLAMFKSFVAEYQQRKKSAGGVLLPQIDMELCGNCGICVDVCPTHAISADCRNIDPARCIKCCACVKSCPDSARSFASPFAPVLYAAFSARKDPTVCISDS